MRVQLVAVGRLKERAERDMLDRYVRRFDQAGHRLGLGPLEIREIPESRRDNAARRKSDEAASLLKAAARADVLVALEGTGAQMSSDTFGRWLAARRDGGAELMAFLIGGPDGHGKAVLEQASLRLSLGPMTLPHGLVRVVLAEQLYRVATILAGHPYHRA
jgi:23S rRNA (pseudouridine1915-N3)-methyltransferase